MIRCLKVALLILFLLVGCNVAAKNQDDSKPVKIRKLVRGGDGIYRIPEDQNSAKRKAEEARKLALEAKELHESKDLNKKTSWNWNYISVYYFFFLIGLIVYIFSKDKSNEQNNF